MRKTTLLGICMLTTLFLFTGCGAMDVQPDIQTDIQAEIQPDVPPDIQTEPAIYADTDGYLAEVEGLLGVDLSGTITEADGEQADGMTCCRFDISDGQMPAVRYALDGKLGVLLPATREDIPGYNGSRIAETMLLENLIGYWTAFADGENGAKTRSMELYLTSDSAGSYHLYFFG